MCILTYWPVFSCRNNCKKTTKQQKQTVKKKNTKCNVFFCPTRNMWHKMRYTLFIGQLHGVFFFLSFCHDFFSRLIFLPQHLLMPVWHPSALHARTDRNAGKNKQTCSTKRWCRTGSPANTPYSPFLFVFCLFLVVCLFFKQVATTPRVESLNSSWNVLGRARCACAAGVIHSWTTRGTLVLRRRRLTER